MGAEDVDGGFPPGEARRLSALVNGQTDLPAQLLGRYGNGAGRLRKRCVDPRRILQRGSVDDGVQIGLKITH